MKKETDRFTVVDDAGKPIDAISRYVGHSNVTITLSMYSHNQMTEIDLFGEEI